MEPEGATTASEPKKQDIDRGKDGLLQSEEVGKKTEVVTRRGTRSKPYPCEM